MRAARLPSSPATRNDGHTEIDEKCRPGSSIHNRPARAVAAPAFRDLRIAPARAAGAKDKRQTKSAWHCDLLHGLNGARWPASRTMLPRHADSGRFQKVFQCSWLIGENYLVNENAKFSSNEAVSEARPSR